MSIAIAIGSATEQPEAVVRIVSECAHKYGYGIISDPMDAEEDMRTGLLQVGEAFRWTAICLLRTPPESKAVLAGQIYEELLQYELEDKSPKFFDFLREVAVELKGVPCGLSVAFSTEWYANEKIRYQKGSIEDLIGLLKRPGNWCERLYEPWSGCYFDSADIPLVFSVHS